MELTLLGLLAITSFGKLDAHGEKVVCTEAGINTMQQCKAADHQAGANQEDERESNFRNDQKLAKPISGSSARCGARILFQLGVEAEECRAQRRDQSEHDAGEQRNGKGKAENRCVDRSVRNSRKPGRLQLHQKAHSKSSENQTGSAP